MTDHVWIVIANPYGDTTYVAGVYSTLEAAKSGTSVDATNPGDRPVVLKWKRDDDTTDSQTRERWELAGAEWYEQTTITRWSVADVEDVDTARALIRETAPR